jgi:polysaccharide biosynthesis protein PslH
MAKRMRVLWVSHLVPYPPKSGVLLRSYHLVRELSRHADVDVIGFIQTAWLDRCFPGQDRAAALADSLAALREFCTPRAFLPIPSEEQWAGKPRLALASLLGANAAVRWLRSAPMQDELSALAAAERYDVVHFDTVSLAQYRPVLRGVPASLGHHNIESHMLLRRAEHEPVALKRWLFRREGERLLDYERSVIPWFDIHVTCSAVDSDRLTEIAPHPNVVSVPNGVDVEYFRPEATPPIDNTFVFVGTMDWYPNVDAMRFFVHEVWPSLKTCLPDATMGVVGGNPPAWLREAATADPSLRVYGFVDDVRPYLAGAKVYVCPIRDGGGTKLKMLDALAMGKAIVAHPLAAEGLDVVAGEHVVYASTAQDYLDALPSLLADEARLAALGRAGRELVVARYAFGMLGRELASHFAGIAARLVGDRPT